MSASLNLTIGELKLRDLRCHRQIHWQCGEGVNLLSGSNGSGKTTLLEAVYMMAHGRSFRQARDPELVRWGESGYSIHGRWRRYGPVHVDVKGTRGQSEVTLQGKKVSRRKDLTEHLPVIADAPQSAKVVDGVPNERRRWLDGIIMATDPGIYRHYQSYMRALMQRSRLLRRTRSSDELEGWELQLVRSGMQLSNIRKEIVDRLNDSLGQEGELLESPLHLEIVATAPESADEWRKRLVQRRDEDARLGRLQIGPHCDRLKILYDGREIRSVGSRGQQKLAAIALRLAECAVRQHARKIVPLLLLDDCLEALDRERQRKLLQRLCLYPGQILMTVPNNSDAATEKLNVHRFHLENGFIQPIGEQGSRPKAMSGQKMEKAA